LHRRKSFFRSGHFGKMEALQLIKFGSWWSCLFCNLARHARPDHRPMGSKPRQNGTHYLIARSSDGRFALVGERLLAGGTVGRPGAGRMVEGKDGCSYIMAFVHEKPDGNFGGTLTDSMPMFQLPDGRLRRDGRA
jgi:hypothetical protein